MDEKDEIFDFFDEVNIYLGPSEYSLAQFGGVFTIEGLLTALRNRGIHIPDGSGIDYINHEVLADEKLYTKYSDLKFSQRDLYIIEYIDSFKFEELKRFNRSLIDRGDPRRSPRSNRRYPYFNEFDVGTATLRVRGRNKYVYLFMNRTMECQKEVHRFQPEEFTTNLSAKALIDAMCSDGIPIPSASLPVEALNSLLNNPHLYKYMRRRPPIETSECIRDIENGWRISLVPHQCNEALAILKINEVNRFLIEVNYPVVCPKSENKSKFDDIRLKLLSVLVLDFVCEKRVDYSFPTLICREVNYRMGDILKKFNEKGWFPDLQFEYCHTFGASPQYTIVEKGLVSYKFFEGYTKKC